MKQSYRSGRRVLSVVSGVIGLGWLAGCGGGGGVSNDTSGSLTGTNTLNVGPFITRAIGLSTPVTAGGSGVVVTGITGGVISGLTLADTSPTLPESRLAYVSNSAGHSQVYITTPDGASQVNISQSENEERWPAWSPDGAKLAITQTDSGGQQHILVMNADGSGKALLGDTQNNSQPDWSPDGSQIAYVSRGDGTQQAQVFAMNADGTNIHPVTNEAVSSVTNPRWSPDGTHILVVKTGTNNQGQIYLLNTDGSNPVRLSKPDASDDTPAWSPDGKRIAYKHMEGARSFLYLMNADGSGAKKLTNSATGNDSLPVWSPDGAVIAFARSTAADTAQVWSIKPDGSALTHLAGDTGNTVPSSWQYLRTRVLIGASGAPLGQTAAGFLFGQKGKSVVSLVVFNAKTPSIATINSQTGIAPGLPNVVMDVSADSVTSLVYIYLNGANQKPTTVIGSGGTVASAGGVLVSFDASDGSVASVLPYNAGRAAGSHPKMERTGDVLIYRGGFLGAWNGSGRNLAPQGASEVRLDAHTGRLLSVK